MTNVWANSMACHPKPPATLQGAATWRIQCHDPRATCSIAWCCHRANSLSWFRSHMPLCRVLAPGEFNDMSSQSHVSRCREGLLPLGEFTVMIPEPHVALQGAVTWWNQCHDCHIARCKNSIRHIFFCFLNAFWALVGSSFRIVCDTLLSRSSRQRERLSASMLSICLFVSLFVCLSVANMQKTRFSQKLSNLMLWCLWRLVIFA